MSLHDAIAKYVESGDSLCFGGFTTNRKPYAAVYEAITRFITYELGKDNQEIGIC